MNENSYFYLNDDHTYRPATLMEWAQQFETLSKENRKHVAEEYALGKRVSTVWLGNNLNFYGGKPLIFETMIFNEKDEDIYCDRYTTWAQAEKGHQKAVQWVKDGCKNECE